MLSQTTKKHFRVTMCKRETNIVYGLAESKNLPSKIKRSHRSGNKKEKRGRNKEEAEIKK